MKFNTFNYVFSQIHYRINGIVKIAYPTLKSSLISIVVINIPHKFGTRVL